MAVSIVVAPVFFYYVSAMDVLVCYCGRSGCACTLTTSEINVSCCCLVGRVVLLHTSREPLATVVCPYNVARARAPATPVGHSTCQGRLPIGRAAPTQSAERATLNFTGCSSGIYMCRECELCLWPYEAQGVRALAPVLRLARAAPVPATQSSGHMAQARQTHTARSADAANSTARYAIVERLAPNAGNAATSGIAVHTHRRSGSRTKLTTAPAAAGRNTTHAGLQTHAAPYTDAYELTPAL